MHCGVKIVVNVAQSLNGLISGNTEGRARISDPADLARVHAMRAEYDAIVVGVNTIISDNPSLKINREYCRFGVDPVRVVLDRNLRIPESSKVLDSTAKTIVFTSKKGSGLKGADVVVLPNAELNVERIVEELASRNIVSILVEGGADVIREFLQSGIVDDFYIYIGNVILPDSGVRLFSTRVEIRDFILDRTNMGNGVLLKVDASKMKVLT